MAKQQDTIVVNTGVKTEDDDFDDDASDAEAPSDGSGSEEFEVESLDESHPMRHPIHKLIALVDGPYMDLDPDYQRGVVWTADRMSKLIDSLMENYYVPPVIFNCFRLAGNDEGERWRRVCIDGKQRISSIHAFIKGKIPCHDKYKRKWYFTAPDHPKRRVLPQSVKESFQKKEILSFEFAALNRQQEEDLFARVQLGMSLNPAEKMRATNGPWQEFARMFEDDFRPIMKLLTAHTQSRSGGFRLFLACFAQILEVQHPTSANGIPTLKTSVTAIDKLIKNPKALDDSMKSHLATVFTTFTELVNEREAVFKDNGYERVKTFSPLEVVAVAVLISKYGDKRNHEMLLGDISMMRIIFRQKHLDLKLNGDCWRMVWEFVDTLEQFRGATDGETAQKKSSSAVAIQPPELTPQASASAKPAKESTKKTTDKTPTRKATPSKTVGIPDTVAPKGTKPRPVVESAYVTAVGSAAESTKRVVTEPPPVATAESAAKAGRRVSAEQAMLAAANQRIHEETRRYVTAIKDVRWKDPIIANPPHAQESPRTRPPQGHPTSPAVAPGSTLRRRRTEDESLARGLANHRARELGAHVPETTSRSFREPAPGRPESPSLFVRSTSPYSVVEVSSDSDDDMPDAPPPMPKTKTTFDVPESVPFSPAQPSNPLSPPRRQVAPVTPMASRAPTSPMPSRPKAPMSRPPMASRPNANVLMAPRPRPTSAPVKPSIPVPDEDDIQAQLSQTFSQESLEEGEIREQTPQDVIERQRRDLLAEFRSTRTPSTGASHSEEDDEDGPPIIRKRRADGSLGAFGSTTRAVGHKKMRRP
ncbi:uncharacterized protein BDZ99DRAFT_570957 [Mytilinidion resinicola]|uniref:GmrSD restriction endonucleases N-terminal domain-containing protein n=1 Tax=Mytilinidion resinicola TaxID=574789 RepID=A0A6A6YR73_9PEZI|nr:uncharacterized protein BDZ99DRAFT_570957 [Mytilinidion resinicola]KAF2810377.1 hypothetical protein BDZ99DRAFT_570957 [Mytilinidion resinicola]